VIISVDPAWQGDDEFVIAKRQGLKFEILRTIPKNDNDIEMASLIATLEDDEEADAVLIDLGWGTGIYSAGKTMGRKWILVNFGGKSNDPGCLNKRAEIWKLGKIWLKEGGSIPKDPQLHAELVTPETVARMDGKLQLESKEDMKSRGASSPNRADALMISFAHPVKERRQKKEKEKKRLVTIGVAGQGWMG
jgi:hypothetical protein